MSYQSVGLWVYICDWEEEYRGIEEGGWKYCLKQIRWELVSHKLAKRACELCPITLSSNTTLMSCTCASEIPSLHNLRRVVRLWWLGIPKHNEFESVAVLG